MKDAGTLDLARAAIAKRRAPGQIAPSKYLPDVPRQVHSAGGKVDDARADFLAGNHPEVPPVVYHSTKGDFHAFRPMSHFGTEKAAHDRYKVGPWNPAHLEMDRNLHNISVIPAHISLKNPIDVGTERDWQGNRDTIRQVADWMGGKLDKKYAYARQKLKDLIDDPRWGDYPHAMEQRGADIIRDTGHDGIIYTNTIEDPGSRSFITLGPEQVKSAISAREFDPENPDMTKAEGGAITKGDGGGITAYHGGPHDFDAFDISKIGTGEGAQSYGHGLYFAGNEDVARQYRNRVSKDKGAFDIINTKTGKMITEETPGYDTIYNAMKSYGSDFRSGDKSHFIENWKRWSDHHEKNTIPEYEAHGGLGDEVSRMKKQVLDWRAAAELMPYAKMRPKGHMYKVNLNVKPEELLDWDKPISEQHPKVQEALKNIGVSTGLTTWENGASLGNGARLIVHKHPDLPDDEEFNRYEMELPSGQRFGLHRNDVARLLGNPKVENGGVRGATVHQRLVDMANREGAIGEHLSLSSPPMKSGPKWAAEQLLRNGIKGIRYLDAGSRGDTDKPTYNYVMFHHDPVKIVDKYAYGGDVDNKPIDLTHEKAKRTMFQTPKHVQDTMTSIADRHAAQVAAYEEAKQAGAFDNAQIGDIYQMPNGTREKIVDHHMIPAERWGSTEPLQSTYQGHYPAVSTMPVDSSNQENMRRRAVQSLAGLTRVGGPLRVAKAGGGGMGDEGFDFKPIPEQSITLSDGSVHYYTPLDVAATENKSISAPAEKNAAYVVGKDDAARNFREWFGNSVTHTDGKPHVFYHGTSKDKDFTSFNVGRHGAWFTRKPEEASQYAEQNDSMGYKRDGWKVVETNTQSRVIPAYLKAENPYTGEYSGAVTGNYKKDQSDWFDTLRAKGHDAWMPSSSGGNLVVVLKEPQQIKSLYNNGNFDPKQKHIAKAGGGGIGDNGDAPVDLGVHRFHQQFMGKIKSTMNDMVDAHQKALQAGVFDGYEVGDKLQGQVGPLTVKARYMAKWKPGGPAESIIRRMGQIPTLMDHNGVTYHPMLRLTGADGSEGDYPLDAVRGYPKFTGLRVAKKNGGGLKLYSKAARIIRGLAEPEDNAEEMVRIALEKGAKKAELQHADVAPGMASRDQVADYIEAVQPRIGVQKLGSHDAGLTDEERDELGYLKSMMPHRISIENIQRIIELENKKISSAKYEQYQLPGGENYREHVLTLDSHSHNDPYYARNHWGKMKNPLAHIRMSDRTAPSDMPTSQWMDARNRMMNAIGVTDRGSLAAGAPDAAVAKGAITPEEARAIAEYYGWTGSKYYKPKKILHVEELQSDWNNDARRKGFGTGTEQQDYDNFVKDMRQKAVEQSGASPMVKAALEKKYSEMEPHTLARKMGMIEQHQELYRRAKFPGPPQAPYVNPKSDDWAELALKHVLHEAAQGGYDGITFTPDAEQSKRWGGTDFNGMYDKKFPGIAARLVKQHDPSITPSTMQITQGVQGPMIPLTEQARRGILENGFSSFKKGGYVK